MCNIDNELCFSHTQVREMIRIERENNRVVSVIQKTFSPNNEKPFYMHLEILEVRSAPNGIVVVVK